MRSDAEKVAKYVAARPDIILAVKTWGSFTVQTLAKEAMNSLGVDFSTIANRTSIVVGIRAKWVTVSPVRKTWSLRFLEKPVPGLRQERL